jgi:hypothetical protein
MLFNKERSLRIFIFATSITLCGAMIIVIGAFILVQMTYQQQSQQGGQAHETSAQ